MSRRVPLITLNATLRLFHPLTFRPTPFRQLYPLRVMYDEIVPDSEPEREEQRRHLDREGRLKRTRKRQAPESTRSMSLVLPSSPEPDISTLSNLFLRRTTEFCSKGLQPPLSRKIPSKQSDSRSVISISGKTSKAYTRVGIHCFADDSSSEDDIPAPRSGSAATHPSNTQANPEPGPSRLPSSRKHPTPTSNASSSEITTGDRSLSSSDLSRYTYKPPQSLRDMIKKRGELEAQRIARFGPPEPLRKSKTTRPAAHRFTDDFTDDALSRILKCVSCNSRWTVRKGATAKMRHIQSCAKKIGISDEIIKRLIRAELEAPEEPKVQQKPKSSGVTNTLFEDMLGDSGKLKNKRKQVQRTTTLHDPAENRKAILAKARSLLEPEIRNLSQDEELVDLLKNSDSTMDRIQMFDVSAPPPATREFGRSMLGKQTSSATLSVLPDESPKMSTSKLADSANKGRRLDILTGEGMESTSVSFAIPRFRRLDNKC